MRRTLAAMAILLLAGCGRDAAVPAAPSTNPVASTPPRPVGQVSTFGITFTADSACTALPSVARSRTYSVEEAAGATVLSLCGGTFGGSSVPGAYRWNVIYQQVVNGAADWWFQDPEIWEQLGDYSYVVIYGGPARIGLETGTMNTQTGEWPFRGRFTYCAEREPDSYPECEVPEVTCESSRHTLTIVRR